jgi:hypothetical protein
MDVSATISGTTSELLIDPTARQRFSGYPGTLLGAWPAQLCKLCKVLASEQGPADRRSPLVYATADGRSLDLRVESAKVATVPPAVLHLPLPTVGLTAN